MEKELLEGLLRHLVIIKMFHFQTASGFKHLKADEYMTEFLGKFDLFFELWQGESRKLDVKTLKIEVTTRSDENFPAYLDKFVGWLESRDTDDWPKCVVSVRDDIVAGARKLHYLVKEFT